MQLLRRNLWDMFQGGWGNAIREQPTKLHCAWGGGGGYGEDAPVVACRLTYLPQYLRLAERKDGGVQHKDGVSMPLGAASGCTYVFAFWAGTPPRVEWGGGGIGVSLLLRIMLQRRPRDATLRRSGGTRARSRGGDSAYPRQRGIHTFCFWDTRRIHTLEPWDTHVIHENHDKKERDLEQPPQDTCKHRSCKMRLQR